MGDIMDLPINLSITEILSLWELQSVNVVIAQKASSILVVLYAIASYKTNQGCFFVAFFLDEMLSNLSFVDLLSEPQYYLMIASIYSILYWYLESKNTKLKTIVACGIIVLFNAGMSIDAIINKEAYSFLYENYLLIAVLVHLYLISTLFSWKLIGKNVGSYIGAWSRIFSINYNFAFFCYAIQKKAFPSETK